MNERPTLSADSILDPRVFVTVTLIVIQLSLLSAIGLGGEGFVVVETNTLERYGALARALVWDKHEYWRLGSAMFLHAGLIHFLLNATCLYFFGGLVEIALGRWRYLFLYFAAGLTGNMASLLWGEPLGMSVGASGAIFGIVVTYLMVQVRGPLHWTQVIRQPASRMLFFLIGIQLAMGFLLRQIDSLAHVGGSLTGVLVGYFFVSQSAGGAISAARRWSALGVWVAAFVALAALIGQPATRANRQGPVALYYFFEGNFSKAAQHFDAAVADNPVRAMEALDEIVQRYVKPRFRIHVTEALLDLLDANAVALEYYRGQLGRRSSPESLWLVATLLQKPATADYEEALGVCAEGKKQYAAKRNWDLLEARIHAGFRQFDRALAALGRLQTTSQPLAAEHWEIVALCHLRRHEWADAERATSRCLTAAWEDLPALAFVGREGAIEEWRHRALNEMGRKSEAQALRAEMEKEWRSVAARSPDDPVALNNLAWFLATHDDDSSEALKLAKRSVELAPEGYNLDTLAWVEHLRGDHKAAWNAMQQALAGRRSGTPEYLYHAGVILNALGNKAESRKYLERAVAAGVDFDEYETAEQMLRDLDK